jgi:DNA polymerase-3 subunit gamma/tau
MVLLRLLVFKPDGQGPTVRANSSAGALAEKKSLLEPAVAEPRPAAGSSAAAAVVQPWEDAPATPQGRVLPVRTSTSAVPSAPVHVPNSTQALVRQAPSAMNVVAVPVRVEAPAAVDVSVASSTTVLVATEEGDFWHTTVQQLIAADAINAMVRELALQSQLVARDTDQWILRVERESLNQSGTRDRLGSALQGAGFDVKLVVEVGRVQDSPARRNNARAAEQQLAAEKIIFDDPFVQSMLRDFGAKIVPGSIKPLVAG